MPEQEKTIEAKLIEQLTMGDSQWTYRPDITTEDALWANIRRILENNNKAILNGTPLTDQEFEQVKNQLSFPTFYDASVWIAGENGKAMVHVQRGAETLHLMALNRADKAGGSSVYEVINQYKATKDADNVKERDRRFDVTLLINGMPMIHIELKNRMHPYMDAFYQIKKYITEGKFTGPFSTVQMFVVSNASNTKYIAPAMDADLNPKFLCGWTDVNNVPVPNYLDFAKQVLSIPRAHEMVTQYIVLDSKARSVILLRPYQIHAILAIDAASRQGKSGFVWHTTGSGKTLTSYKCARNLLIDVPSIEKTIFLIDRIALDNQTTQAFQSYAVSDVVDVDETENVTDLMDKLGNDSQQMIVTTIQKLNFLIKRLSGKESSARYQRIANKRVAFIVDECHRTVTPEKQRILTGFFRDSLWYGFTGTPIFKENAYKAQGDLPRTTEEMFGPVLQKYTIKDAIRDQTVLGFQVEYLGPHVVDTNGKQVKETNAIYDSRSHRLAVLNTILNQCGYSKLGIEYGSGKSYQGMLTTDSIPHAQIYYSLLKEVKSGTAEVKIDPEILKHLPDFPKFAITYSVSEDEERSVVDQRLMQESLDDYNEMFGTKFDMSQIKAYNTELSDRLARKQNKYKARSEQLDLVIVVDRLLTGFDSPSLSTVFVDRDPMPLHNTIQMFSRTNRLYDQHKPAGQIVTFRSADLWKKTVNDALVLYSDGGEASAVSPDWQETETAFTEAIRHLHETVTEPDLVPALSLAGKKRFAKAFQNFDSLYASIRSFTCWAGKNITDYGMTDKTYEEYLGQYKNVMAELSKSGDDVDNSEDDPDYEYRLKSFDKSTIDYEYIVALIQEYISGGKDINLFRLQKMEEEINGYIKNLNEFNPKLGALMQKLWNDITKNPDDFKDKRVATVLEDMRMQAVEECVNNLCEEWCINKEALLYAADTYQSGSDIPNLKLIKDTSDFEKYQAKSAAHVSKLQYYRMLTEAIENALIEEIVPLQGQEM